MLLGELGNPTGPVVWKGGNNIFALEVYSEAIVDGFEFTHSPGVQGGAIWVAWKFWYEDPFQVIFKNCLIHGNTADYGAALQNRGQIVTLIHCTLAGNSATSFGNAIYNSGGLLHPARLTIVNSILWNSTGIAAEEISNNNFDSVDPLVNSSIVRGGQFASLNQDPLFSSGYRLNTLSPAVNGGITSTDLGVDLYGQPRPSAAHHDMGSEEFQDADADGLTDEWESAYGLDPNNAADAALDPDGDGLSNLEEFQQGKDPNDFYNGATPFLLIDSGNHQIAVANQFVAAPLVVKVADALLAGNPYSNATVTFSVLEGGAQLATTDQGTPQLATLVTVSTNPQGLAQVYLKLPEQSGVPVRIQAQTQNQSVIFTAYAQGLVSEWKFESVTPTLVNDTGGLNLNLVRKNGVEVATSAGFDGMTAASLDGTNDYLEISDPANGSLDFAQGQSFVLSAWFKTTASGHRRFISKGFWGWQNGYLLGIGLEEFGAGNGKVTFGMGAAGVRAQSFLIGTTGNFNDGQWHHAVAVYDAVSKTAKIYVNGQLQGLQKASGYGGTILSGNVLDTQTLNNVSGENSNPFHLGSHNGAQEFLQGNLDDVRIYRGTLTPQQILDLTNPDSDQDGLSDAWEQQIIDANLTDGITSLADVRPEDDFDGDGMSNFYEYKYGLNQLIDDSGGDKDGDGVLNKHDARPNNTAIGALTITITSPSNGVTLN
ncbi:MAG: LamG domain-containing protein [Blastochloris sp.]|nr:LamG domain-containing protein [Blastochloris sp.]